MIVLVLYMGAVLAKTWPATTMEDCRAHQAKAQAAIEEGRTLHALSGKAFDGWRFVCEVRP